MEVLRFEHAAYLHLLWGVFVLIGFFIWIVKYKQALLKRFGNLEILQKLMRNYSTRRRNIKYILIIFSYVFFVIALANPQIGRKLEEFTREGVDIIVALDVSKKIPGGCGLQEEVAEFRRRADLQWDHVRIKAASSDNRGSNRKCCF